MAKKRKTSKLSDAKERRIAYHEAGHAVAYILLGKRLKVVTIVPDPDAGTLGHTEFSQREQNFRPDTKSEVDGRTRKKLERDIMICLAGIEGEKIVSGRYNRQGAHLDFVSASCLARCMADDDKEAEAYMSWLQVRIGNKLRECFVSSGLEAVAEALLEHKTLSGHKCKRIYHAATVRAMKETI